MKLSPAKPQSDCPEFAVRYEAISSYFVPPMPRSTFHKRVEEGKIIPMKGMRGFYKLNDSLRRLGLREVRELPKPVVARSLEDLVRLAFTKIDQSLFPEPSWLLPVEAINMKDADHASLLADRYRGKVDALDHVETKLAYFHGVLDSAAMVDAERNS